MHESPPYPLFLPCRLAQSPAFGFYHNINFYPIPSGGDWWLGCVFDQTLMMMIIIFQVESDADLDAFVRAKSDSAYHPSCTCKMGKDDMAVVDNAGKVRIWRWSNLKLIRRCTGWKVYEWWTRVWCQASPAGTSTHRPSCSQRSLLMPSGSTIIVKKMTLMAMMKTVTFLNVKNRGKTLEPATGVKVFKADISKQRLRWRWWWWQVLLWCWWWYFFYKYHLGLADMKFSISNKPILQHPQCYPSINLIWSVISSSSGNWFNPTSS